MKCYAGIGSRRTPEDVLALMTALAACLRQQGWTLRSGNAEGADLAFQAGAGADAEVFVPWPSFGPAFQAGAIGYVPEPRAYQLAAKHHPNWDACSTAAKHMHARNCQQVLGLTLNEPSRFVVCWTPDGSLDGTGPGTGGTGQALRVAHHYGVPVFNLARPEHRQRVERFASLRFATTGEIRHPA
jgi:hypothetical protein